MGQYISLVISSILVVEFKLHNSMDSVDLIPKDY